jgi:hypothetical protein
LGVFTHPV